MSDFPDFEWPTDPEIQAVLEELLMAQLSGLAKPEYPGAGEIAKKLAKGTAVLTTTQAEEIWHGGLGNFIEYDRNPGEGVGVIKMRMKFDVWRSQQLLGVLQGLNEKAVEAAAKAEARRLKIYGALQFCEDNIDEPEPAATGTSTSSRASRSTRRTSERDRPTSPTTS